MSREPVFAGYRVRCPGCNRKRRWLTTKGVCIRCAAEQRVAELDAGGPSPAGPGSDGDVPTPDPERPEAA